jgi:adenylate cyclase
MGLLPMSHVFISYARSTADEAQTIAEALRGLGHDVWLDDEIPVHRAYADVIEERLRAAKAVVVIWSAEAVKSQWVQSEADRAREDGKLVQLNLDGARLPMPFDRIQCADLTGWSGDPDAPGWKKVAASVAELARPAAAAPPPPEPAAPAAPPTISRLTVAVLPISGQGPDAAAIAEGLGEEIVAALSQDRLLVVVAGRKDHPADPQDAARRLGANFGLTGSVRQAGGRLRVSVKLIDVADGVQVWAERFEGNPDDVFDLQDRVARTVAGRIITPMFAAQGRRLTGPIEQTSPWGLVLEALGHASSFEPKRIAEAIVLLDRALALDPRVPMGLAMGAWSRAFLSLTRGEPERSRLQAEARAMAERAIHLEPNSAGSLMPVSEALFAIGEDTVATRALIERAVALNPANSAAVFTRGWMKVGAGDLDGGVADLEGARDLDPMAATRPHTLTWLGAARMGQGRFREAVALLKEAEQFRAAYPLIPPLLAACYGHLGEAAAARQAVDQLEQSDYDLVVYAGYFFREATLNDVFLKGIALARGGTPETDA